MDLLLHRVRCRRTPRDSQTHVHAHAHAHAYVHAHAHVHVCMCACACHVVVVVWSLLCILRAIVKSSELEVWCARGLCFHTSTL